MLTSSRIGTFRWLWSNFCSLGILLNEGNIEGVEANPKQAVVWWRRCVDYHRHIWAAFEIGVALYTGEGVAENPVLASKYFRQAGRFVPREISIVDIENLLSPTAYSSFGTCWSCVHAWGSPAKWCWGGA